MNKFGFLISVVFIFSSYLIGAFSQAESVMQYKIAFGTKENHNFTAYKLLTLSPNGTARIQSFGYFDDRDCIGRYTMGDPHPNGFFNPLFMNWTATGPGPSTNDSSDCYDYGVTLWTQKPLSNFALQEGIQGYQHFSNKGYPDVSYFLRVK